MSSKRSCWKTVGLVLPFLGAPAFAQSNYPAKPVRIIVPTIAGAGLDTLTRLVAQKLTEKSGKAFVVDNRAGAGGAIPDEKATRIPVERA